MCAVALNAIINVIYVPSFEFHSSLCLIHYNVNVFLEFFLNLLNV